MRSCHTAQWTDIGSVEELKKQPLQVVFSGKTTIALTYKGGSFAAISGVCSHVGGPLGEGALDGDYVVCPWHYWKFHRGTGQGESGYEQDQVPSYATKIENGRLYIDLSSATKQKKRSHKPASARTPGVAEAGHGAAERADRLSVIRQI